MRVHRTLRRLVAACLPAIHAHRFAALVTVVEAVIQTGRLSVSAIGRGVRSRAASKHSIK